MKLSERMTSQLPPQPIYPDVQDKINHGWRDQRSVAERVCKVWIAQVAVIEQELLRLADEVDPNRMGLEDRGYFRQELERLANGEVKP